MNFGYKINRPVLLLAPDAIVTINQSISLPVCKDCGASSKIVDLITRLNVNSGIETVPSTASFDLAVPRHESSQVYEQGKLNLPLMSEVQIFIKGRYLDTDGNPLYYQVFWGMITNVEVSYSDGFYSIHVSCEDMLKWWSITKVIETDSALNSLNTRGPFRALANNFSYLTGPEIIYALTLAMFSDVPILESPNVGNVAELQKIISSQGVVYDNALAYWRNRFYSLGQDTNLSIAGLKINSDRAKSIRSAILFETKSKLDKPQDLTQLDAEEAVFDDFTRKSLPLYSELSTSTSPMNLGVKSALEIALDVKDRINYEFFMDTGGIVTFKPPYFNASTKRAVFSNQKIGTNPYIIEDLDLLSYSISHNLDQIYSRIDIEGSFTGQRESSIKTSVFYVDEEKAKQYGIKQTRVSYHYALNTKSLYKLAIADLNRLNQKEYTGTIEIAGRPELKLGTPVYLKCEDIYGYINGISHQFDFGQSYTTTLSIDTIRRKIYDKKKYILYTEEKKDFKKIRQQIVDAVTTEDSTELMEKIFQEFKSTNPGNKKILSNSVSQFISFSEDTDLISMFFKFIKQKLELETNQSIKTIQQKIIPLGNALTTSNTTYKSAIQDKEIAKNEVGFQKTDEDGYEILPAFQYGLNLGNDPNTSNVLTVNPADITAAASQNAATSNQSKKCSCVKKN